MAQRQPQLAAIDWERFGAHLREMREERGLSLRQLTKYCGISTPTLSRIEKGNECSAEVFMSACFWMEVEPTDFRLT